MKKTFATILIAFSIYPIILSAQTANDNSNVHVRGKVIDRSTNAGVTNTAVQLMQKGKIIQATQSDSLGNFEFKTAKENFTDTIFAIKVIAPGYEPKVIPDMNLKKLTATMKTIIPIRKEE